MTDAAHNPPGVSIGAAYYPEHWPEERWLEDIQLMAKANLNVVRMAEFAWSTMEPAEGEFDFDWLERAINLLAVNGIRTVLGTPTAAPPAWLVNKYPEILPIDENGKRVQFGNRCHYCVNAPDFHAAAMRIVEAMAQRFGGNPNVIGWQIDNEYNRVCYCKTCQKQFQAYLANKYGLLDELNRRWSTAYWSQTYSAWEQIPTPVGNHNPGLMLEWKRFITASYRKFQALQIAALRPHLPPEVWITHNFMGWYDGFDHYELTADLDMAAWDWYVGTGHNDPYFSGSTHDLTRGFKRKNFWVMETQPGAVNWARLNNALYKGEARSMAWEAVAHGADGLLYWQWRSALGGQEQLHGTLIDPSGQPRPFYAEVEQIAAEFARLGDKIAGSTVPTRAAILNDYESRWSIQWQKFHKDFDYLAHLQHYYRPLAQMNILLDVISPDQQLTYYKLLFAPSLILFDDERFAHVLEFVEKGGYLVLTPRTAWKNRDNAFLPSRPPGKLSEYAGVEVEEFYALNEDVPIKGNWFTGTSRTWAERLKILNAAQTLIVARYGESNGWLDKQVGLTVKGHKSGMIYTVGAYLDDKSQAAFIKRITQVAGIQPVMDTPAGVTANKRVNKQKQEFIFLINHTRQEQKVALRNAEYDDLLTETRHTGEIILEPYGVAVLQKGAVVTQIA